MDVNEEDNTLHLIRRFVKLKNSSTSFATKAEILNIGHLIIQKTGYKIIPSCRKVNLNDLKIILNKSEIQPSG